MLDFMVIAAPRSGTTWLANLLTTDTTHCLHDPLFKRHYSDLDRIESKKTLGIACTGLWMFPEFIAAHPARKVILHRDMDQVNASLAQLGLAPVLHDCNEVLHRIHGRHYEWADIFNPKIAPHIFGFLLQKPFDEERYSELRKMRVEPEHERVPFDKAVTQRLFRELHADDKN